MWPLAPRLVVIASLLAVSPAVSQHLTSEDTLKELKPQALGAPEGGHRKLSGSEIEMLASIIRSLLRGCWRLPVESGASDIPVVALKWRLKPDGSLDGEPQIEGA